MTDYESIFKTMLTEQYSEDAIEIAANLQKVLKSKYDLRVQQVTGHNDWIPDSKTLIDAYAEFPVSEALMLKTVESFRPVIEDKGWPLNSTLKRKFLMHCRMHLSEQKPSDDDKESKHSET